MKTKLTLNIDDAVIEKLKVVSSLPYNTNTL